MRDLFRYARAKDATPPLVKARVLHYELELIHPFSDGNGCVGRLWQHMLLCAYSSVSAHALVESMSKTHQRAYYRALAGSDKAGDATMFVEFMLEPLHAAPNGSHPSFDLRAPTGARGPTEPARTSWRKRSRGATTSRCTAGSHRRRRAAIYATG